MVMMEGDIIKLDGNYSIQIKPSKKGKAFYIFRDKNTITHEMEGVEPIRLSDQSNIAKKIKKGLNPQNRYKSEVVNDDFQTIRVSLQEEYESLLLIEEQVEREEKEAYEQKLKTLKSEATEKLKSLSQPLTWIASITDWVTAGERNNITLCFIAYASQVILNNPISVVALGDAGSGKTHVLKIAMGYIPIEFIVFEKKITEAALFRRSEKDPYFYDGKIVNYGDMGGANDLEFAEESKALMKELQSDGYLNKPLNVPNGEGGYEIKDLELFGTPSLTYSTVPGYSFDEQEMSRSIFITPRMDNQEVFNKMTTYLEFRGATYSKMLEYKKESELIKYMVYDLKDKLEDIEIINPYVHIIIKYLKNSRYYKRDYPKYNNLLKTITALGYYTHTVYDLNGRKVIFVTLDDIQLFMSLLEIYEASINANLSLKATEILNDLKNNIDEWTACDEGYLAKTGISVNEYIEKSDIFLNKRSVQRYFGELNENGFIKIVEKQGNTNVWNLTNKYKPEDKEDLLKITDKEKERATNEIGDVVAEFFEKDKLTDGLSIMRQNEMVSVPPWEEE